MQLYAGTQGEGWTDNTGWGSGEPCVDAWFGVTCCPRSHQQLSRDGQLCLGEVSVNESDAVPPPHPSACHSNSYSGIPENDAALCVVVRLTLPNNNLTGSLAGGVLALPVLTGVDLRNNNITGAIPSDLAPSIVSLDLRSNKFDYPPPNTLTRDCLS